LRIRRYSWRTILIPRKMAALTIFQNNHGRENDSADLKQICTAEGKPRADFGTRRLDLKVPYAVSR